jgi:hypothetical protein
MVILLFSSVRIFLAHVPKRQSIIGARAPIAGELKRLINKRLNIITFHVKERVECFGVELSCLTIEPPFKRMSF